MDFKNKEVRREFCMFAALAISMIMLVLASLSFSHNIGYWPYGQPQPQVQASAVQGLPSLPGDGLTQLFIYGLAAASFLTVGVLYYLGRRTERHAPALIDSGKLSLEVVAGYAGWVPTEDAFTIPEMLLLLRIRVINKSEPSVTITGWKISMSTQLITGAGSWHEATIVKPPAGLAFRPMLGRGPSYAEQKGRLDVDIVSLTAEQAIPFGPHKDGFILAKTFTPDLLCWLSLYTIAVQVTGSQGGKSLCFAHPGEWLRDAEFSIDAALPLMRGLMPPPVVPQPRA
jgi:hypothetical protein